MAEEFNQGGVCGGNWWNSSRNLFASSPCSMAINDAGSFGWPNHDHLILDTRTTRSSDDSAGSASDDSTLQMMGISLNSSSTTSDVIWNNQDILHDNGRSDENYSNILQEINGLNSSMNNYQNSPQNSKNYCDDPLINSFKQVNQSIIPLDQPLNCITNSTTDCVATTCQELLSPNFPLNSASYSLLQTLFDTDSQTEQSLLNKYQPMNYSINSHEFLPGFTNASTPLRRNEEARDIASVAKKASNEPAFKRQRIETPSPLPTFKTDTASVLHEAIEYIKFLHDQVSVADKLIKDQEVQKQDLKSRGLCLVPISSTFPVAAETSSDFWTPTFGGSFK
ncbi:hypothetical protein BUALT_Bualt03G0069600 [Buddleja alternifolia]|uniref:BHLH domain-containing protein n=1 Tax=Buddleja alternifolia TaxID=168488 RepID=A0AAV6Y2H2_9LAMI|nr:hypothetical protein BUALT_Bualt03G0069600 [Buddleja alternifolia]